VANGSCAAKAASPDGAVLSAPVSCGSDSDPSRRWRGSNGRFGGRSFRTAEAVSDATPTFADAQPEELASVWNSDPQASNKKLGSAFRTREDRRYGADQYRIARDGTVEHGAGAVVRRARRVNAKDADIGESG
jgi:hypothetical protein